MNLCYRCRHTAVMKLRGLKMCQVCFDIALAHCGHLDLKTILLLMRMTDKEGKMLKKRITTLALLLFLGASAWGCHAPPPPPPPNKDWSITIGFNYDFTNFVVCSATVTKGCITGFTWGYNQGATAVTLKTSTAAICATSSSPAVCTDTANSTLGIGPITAFVVANGIDNTGVPVSSAPSAPSPVVNIIIGVPVNVTWSQK